MPSIVSEHWHRTRHDAIRRGLLRGVPAGHRAGWHIVPCTILPGTCRRRSGPLTCSGEFSLSRVGLYGVPGPTGADIMVCSIRSGIRFPSPHTSSMRANFAQSQFRGRERRYLTGPSRTAIADLLRLIPSSPFLRPDRIPNWADSRGQVTRSHAKGRGTRSTGPVIDAAVLAAAKPCFNFVRFAETRR